VRSTLGRSFLATAALALTSGCGSGMRLSVEQMDSIHRACTKHIANGRVVTAGRGDIGRIMPPKPKGTPVVIYGATWCEPCDTAKRYLARRGIPFVERDVEEEPKAKAAMDATIVAAGLATASALPVLDVRGTVTYGFMPCVVDAAWDES
jgi:glutaredoxin